jgi:ketosteroid isomerase-like protein
MNTLLRLIYVSVFTATHFGFAASAVDRGSIEAEILRLDTRRIEALVKADMKALDEIYSDDLIYVHSAGKIDSKQPYLALLTSGSLNYVSQRYDPPARVVVAGPDTAFVTGRVTIELKSRTDQITKRVLTTTTVYARGAAGWKAILYQSTPVQP